MGRGGNAAFLGIVWLAASGNRLEGKPLPACNRIFLDSACESGPTQDQSPAGLIRAHIHKSHPTPTAQEQRKICSNLGMAPTEAQTLQAVEVLFFSFSGQVQLFQLFV